MVVVGLTFETGKAVHHKAGARRLTMSETLDARRILRRQYIRVKAKVEVPELGAAAEVP